MVPFTFSIFFQVKFFTATDGCGTGCVVTEPFDRSIGYEVAFSVLYMASLTLPSYWRTVLKDTYTFEARPLI